MKKLRFAALLAMVGFAAFGQDLYQIGDEGPAGGIIFYDKGTFSEGWRYLEAAPPETEWIAEWGAVGISVGITTIGIGGGKRNTRIIVDALRRLGETGKAAQVCAGLNHNGFNDWFLPSQEELDMMYQTLCAEGWGNFSGTRYWSSTQFNAFAVCLQDFTDGLKTNTAYKTNKSRVRAIRSF